MIFTSADMPKVLAHMCKHGQLCPMDIINRKGCPFLLQHCSDCTELAWKIHLGFTPWFDPEKFGFDLYDVESVGYEYEGGRKCILIEREHNSSIFMQFYDGIRVATGFFERYFVRLTNGTVRYLSNDEYLTLEAALRKFV